MLFKANFIKKKIEKILSFKTSWKGLVPPTIYGILNTIEILIEVKRKVFCIEQILISIVCYSRPILFHSLYINVVKKRLLSVPDGSSSTQTMN